MLTLADELELICKEPAWGRGVSSGLQAEAELEFQFCHSLTQTSPMSPSKSLLS